MPGQRLKWIIAPRNGGSPPSAAVSGQLVPAGKRVTIYAFRCLNGEATADFYDGTDSSGTLLSTCVAPDGGNDRDDLDSAGGMMEAYNGVYVRIFGSAYDAAILVDASTVAA